jgi:DNA-directed RNA polymerase subunit RPC12/RpoP
MKLIRDLGMKKANVNSKRAYRYGLYECPVCKKHFEAIANSVNTNHTTKCRACATSLIVKSKIKQFSFEPTKENVTKLFLYKDGELYFKEKLSIKHKIGDCVGSYDKLGYKKTKIKGKTYSIHRLIWIYHFGYSDMDIDHIDHNTSNNKIENLRLVTHRENCQNRKLRSDNTSGYNGVMLNKSKDKWEVWLSDKYIGCFKDKNEAIKVRKLAEQNANYHKNHGKDILC